MLKELRIKNFKCFQNELIIPIDRINLLTGLNGRGKSTAIQPLLCMKQSYEELRTGDRLFLNGNCVELGSYEDIKNINTPRNEPILFGLEFESGRNYFIAKYKFKEDEADDLTVQIDNINVEGKYEGEDFKINVINKNGLAVLKTKRKREPFLNLFVDHNRYREKAIRFVAEKLFNLERIHYISADRIGPRPYYPRESLSKFSNVGSVGQYTINIIEKMQDKLVCDELVIDKKSASTVIDQLDAWIENIFFGGSIYIKNIDSNLISMRMNADSSANKFKPYNVGYGYSYALPIIVSGLIAKKGDFLIVENPEAHLVPQSQSRIARFLNKVSLGGVQVFIESHSEHIFNGLRIAALEKPYTYRETNILIFQGEKDYYVRKIPLDEKAQVINWPEGFFDQTEKDFEKIHGIS